ncbi:hypothetical protein F5878DRAFT_667032 [Lentinula raphanica]|uniref:Uncharacterized protein n=1 Tax=Lentinula raphanica TaxID=153919 RepID=A0AA38NWQ2_9AGAR|nr:hypothetical protein F5878DRAFT_667032 [Lentinula raphanica]
MLQTNYNMLNWKEKDLQAVSPKLDELMSWNLEHEFESLSLAQQQTSHLLNITELRDTIRLTEQQLVKQKLQLIRLFYEHYRTVDAVLDKSGTTVGSMPAKLDHPVPCSKSTDNLLCSDEDSFVSEYVPQRFATRVVRENEKLTVYCGNAKASVTLD